MDVRVQGPAPTEPFLGAGDLFETEHDLELPVRVQVRENPDERTWTAHYDTYHTLNISRQAASSAMARELALHEYSHMRRYEQSHPSHTQSTAEALVLALAGRSIERRKLAHCYQIANHMKDIYADDITLAVAPADKLVAFLESSLADALADRPTKSPGAWQRLTPASDPDITAVNAAFALALCERHELLDRGHRLYDLAHAAANDAPRVGLDAFKSRFRSLAHDPDPSQYRKALVDITRRYTLRSGHAAD
jgi:hypothetical protein